MSLHYLVKYECQKTSDTTCQMTKMSTSSRVYSQWKFFWHHFHSHIIKIPILNPVPIKSPKPTPIPIGIPVPSTPLLYLHRCTHISLAAAGAHACKAGDYTYIPSACVQQDDVIVFIHLRRIYTVYIYQFSHISCTKPCV